jgi:hypothetical protein
MNINWQQVKILAAKWEDHPLRELTNHLRRTIWPPKPVVKIEVQQRGLATGQIVAVRRVKRVHIPVNYVE